MNARLQVRLLKSVPKKQEAEPKPSPWASLSEPVDPMETHLRMRAQSILSGPLLGQCPPLTIEQARDVIAWAK